MPRKILITATDREKLLKLINKAKYEQLKNDPHLMDLETEINRAEIVNPEQLPKEVITMNSKVLLLVGDEEEEITLVFPNEANILENKISVLSPIGTAILGYREGSDIEWKVPNGTVLIKVKKVLYQPEAAQLKG
ncbi:MAG: nucleoside diphosphate kinase regulator [Desulfitobacteriia bacterium]|jgi:regulator of nucleoside diphosphate kinase